MYAHIYKAPARTGYKFVLYLTKFEDLSQMDQDMDAQEIYFESKADAKSAARKQHATPWNY